MYICINVYIYIYIYMGIISSCASTRVTQTTITAAGTAGDLSMAAGLGNESGGNVALRAGAGKADDADRQQDTTTKATGTSCAYQGANDQEDDASDLERDHSYFIVPSWAWPCTQACIRSLIEVACFH